jgi:hypothetical protein
MAFAFVAASTWVFAKSAWDQTDSTDPRKLFAREVFATTTMLIPHFRQNITEGIAGEEKPRRWFRSRRQNAAHN